MWRLRTQAANEQIERQCGFVQSLDNDPAAAFPGRHQDEQRDTRDDGKGPTLKNLRGIGRKVQAVHQQKAEQHRNRQPARHLPQEQSDCR
ncbi:hypothetical protein D3C80_2047510 [compost metagenome]